jgi:hypothetical protein
MTHKQLKFYEVVIVALVRLHRPTLRNTMTSHFNTFEHNPLRGFLAALFTHERAAWVKGTA